MRGLGDVVGNRFRHALYLHLRTARAGAFGHRMGHRLQVTVRGVVKNQNLSHESLH